MIAMHDIHATLGGRPVLAGIDLMIPRGEAVALVGPNGAGKTTLLRCLVGLVRCSGRIAIDGIDVAADPIGARSRVGYMPQVPAFCEESARRSLTFIAKLRGAPVDQVDALLDQVGLADHAHRSVRTFSTGMRQRLLLAAALVGAPPLLVLDEPTASLDRDAQAEIVALLRRLRDGGTTLLLCSHRSEEIRAIAHRVVELEQGRVVGDTMVDASPDASDDASPAHAPPLRLVKHAMGAIP
jgi:ABC-type multidrug transport system ATPase subunit